MRRRAALATLAAAFAGCSFDAGRGTTPTLTPANVPEETPTPDDDVGVRTPKPRMVGPELATVATVGATRTAALRPTRNASTDGSYVILEFVREATPERPAMVRATLANRNDQETTFRLRGEPPFGDPFSDVPEGLNRSQALAFAPTGRNDLSRRSAAVERGPEGSWRLADLGPWLPETVRLAPGESVTVEFALVGHPEAVGRPSGTYRWRGRGPGLSATVWDSESPGPTGDSRFAGRTVPSLADSRRTHSSPDEVYSTRWYHEAGPETATYLEPSAERVAAGGSATFTLVNHSRDELSGGGWALHKLVDSQWFYVEPRLHGVLRMLTPGATETYELHVFHGDVGCDCSVGVGHLGGGTYAFEATYSRSGSDGLEKTRDEGGIHAALFELDAPELVVTRTEAASVVERGEREVVVRRPEYGDESRASDGALLLDRVDAISEHATRFVPEQVMRPRHRALRDALATFEPGVERVRVQTSAQVAAEAVGRGRTDRRFTFQGQRYRATASVRE